VRRDPAGEERHPAVTPPIALGQEDARLICLSHHCQQVGAIGSDDRNLERWSENSVEDGEVVGHAGGVSVRNRHPETQCRFEAIPPL
jgi:hypothetical protein